ncbi:Alpha-D-glucose-1-phosphate phosphatase YihX [Oceanibacterium hippocampi]|uniref:Alpha-D-glucose-1-phosphate phosphatase YihX n=2 Tax=Oceanibacterium hippocampi TaxID=745714 RepID=A0A1Y5TRG3_9PROT|nr:HAD-IA family hydrolase [Oceanibacterium hippocampi]SLN70171.1 Alpha-D-glucose-1-phosphate phosphatase YihX [Oceanibacterium hippocampi]
MIKAVLWDFGGVFTTSPFDNFSRYERENGLPANFLRGINATNPDSNAWARFERSEIDLDAFDRLFETESRAAGRPVPGRQIIALLAGQVRPEMVIALRRCREQFVCGCITNNVAAGSGPGMATDPERADEVAEVMSLFHLVVESSRLGLRKPDPEIYAHACRELAIDPKETVYLDDLGINLKPARAMGMRTIKVSAAGPALAELETLLGIPLR